METSDAQLAQLGNSLDKEMVPTMAQATVRRRWLSGSKTISFMSTNISLHSLSW